MISTLLVMNFSLIVQYFSDVAMKGVYMYFRCRIRLSWKQSLNVRC